MIFRNLLSFLTLYTTTKYGITPRNPREPCYSIQKELEEKLFGPLQVTPEEARDIIKRIDNLELNMEVVTEYARLCHVLGQAYDALGQIDGATTEYEKSLSLAPSFIVKYDLGRAYSAQNRFDEAIEQFEPLLDEGFYEIPHEYVYFQLGWIYMRLDDFDNAIQAYKNAIKRSPFDKYAAPHYGLGLVYGKLGRLDEAEQEAKIALKIGDTSAEELLKWIHSLR